ncbi:MAG TPA: DUF2652 domain-containing protein [Candidatus Limnocylindria bacterium]|nr:DUF2652 domain-containing protein [Candidatus Limnocylindria bacterium]
MLKGVERGTLVIADISGYTGLLVDTELEHAQDAVRDLIQTVVGKLRPQLRLAKLEGDAAFVYSISERIDGSQLLDTLEAAYFAFRRRLESISLATTCDCNACIRIPGLNLKLIAHHGSFVRQRLYGVEELTGSDVIVVHRLLKNRVAEQVGSGGYLLLTDACLAAATLDPAALRLVEYRDELEGVGEVTGWVHDLETAWRRERELRRVRIGEKETALMVEADIPAAPQVVWDWVTDPTRRPQFVPGVLRVDEVASAGRRGVGTTNHCMHGEGVTLEEILDWRPFDYFTLQTTLPNGLSAITMEELVAAGAGTHVIVRVAKQKTAKGREVFGRMSDMIAGMYAMSLAQLGRIVEADR